LQARDGASAALEFLDDVTGQRAPSYACNRILMQQEARPVGAPGPANGVVGHLILRAYRRSLGQPA